MLRPNIQIYKDLVDTLYTAINCMPITEAGNDAAWSIEGLYNTLHFFDIPEIEDKLKLIPEGVTYSSEWPEIQRDLQKIEKAVFHELSLYDNLITPDIIAGLESELNNAYKRYNAIHRFDEPVLGADPDFHAIDTAHAHLNVVKSSNRILYNVAMCKQHLDKATSLMNTYRQLMDAH